jgi:DNA helicase-2/ATP-dependent DNA helicase PcrA
MVNAANRVAGIELDPNILLAEAEAAGHALLEHWVSAAMSASSTIARQLSKLISGLMASRSKWKEFIKTAIPLLLETASVAQGAVSDAVEDNLAWNACLKEVRSELGSDVDLPELVQGMALRSKEPPRDSKSVALMTIHAAKGLESDYVYVIGLAEGEIPSWQSVQKGDKSAEMEEERRNCFVAITRTREMLCLSYAKNYRGWNKPPSRFLKEMSIEAKGHDGE